MHGENDHHQRGLRVLVVDDNHDAASTMSALLEFEGHRTGTAHDGLEAVQEATRVRYDAVLLDLGMPIMDGFQAAVALSQLTPAPVLIACSAWDDDETRSRTADLGFSMHLRKPVPFQMLKAALQELLPESAAATQPSKSGKASPRARVLSSPTAAAQSESARLGPPCSPPTRARRAARQCA